METRFHYLLDRLERAEFDAGPFPHLYLRDFLSETDFKEITTADEVDLPVAGDLDELFAILKAAGYEPVEFPGCTKFIGEYRRWIEKASKPSQTHKACEGQGMALRLKRPTSGAVLSLDAFFRSPEFNDALRAKFGVSSPTRLEAGLQKYLHGYEISPHPDIRSKALTWMLNVNPSRRSETLGFHTHYLVLKPEYSFLYSLWRNNPTIETCWVPWDWCSTVKQQPENNSIVLFAPRWDTMHAIRAHYGHLATQRTQFYGNLWYEETSGVHYRPEFSDYDFTSPRYREPRAAVHRARYAMHSVRSRL
jgi:hypothetical protein